MNSLENSALVCLEESLMPSDIKVVRGKSKYIGNGTKDSDLGSELDPFIKRMQDQPLVGKYLEVHTGGDSARGQCIGFCVLKGYPYLLLQDGSGNTIMIECNKAQRKIYEFVPSGGKVTDVTGTGSSDDPALYTMSKKNY
jgi:hypothetical protein